MPESLYAPARDALAAAVELADLCAAEMHLDEPDDWAALAEAMRAAVRRIDAGSAVLAAVLDAHQAASAAT